MRIATKASLAALGLALAALPACGVEANHADQAELERLGGVGPAISERILAARRERPFDDWRDLMDRVKGIKPKAAQRLSDDGLTVNGHPYRPAPH